MSDASPIGTGATIFQLQASSADRTLSEATSASGLPGTGDPVADLETASEQFESLMLNFMIREMRATIPESGLFPESMAEEIFTSMLDEQLGEVMAQSGGIGISRMLFEQLNTVEPVK